MNNESLVLFEKIIFPELWNTLYMVIFATVLSAFFGFILAIILTITDKDGLRPNKYIQNSLGVLINTIRSFPFIIFIVAIMPFTRFIIGTSIGREAAIVALTIAGSSFMSRLLEISLKEVDKGLIEAAKSFGASDLQIIFKIMIKETIPSIISAITLAVISILGFSAMAGAVGAGGLGAIGLTYGYQNFNYTIMYGTVIILVILVQIFQSTGNILYRKLK